MRLSKILLAAAIAVAVAGVTSCEQEDFSTQEEAQTIAESTRITVSSFPSFTEQATTRSGEVGFFDAGKDAWEKGDLIYLKIEQTEQGAVEPYAAQLFTLTYKGEEDGWQLPKGTAAISLSAHAYSDMVSVTAWYAPDYDFTEEGELVLKDGVVAGQAEVLTYQSTTPYYESLSSIDIVFDRSKCDYARLRFAGKPYASYTVAITNFTPVDGMEETEASYTLTMDSKGNGYLYGTWTSESTINGNAIKSASKAARSYAYLLEKWNEGLETGLPIVFIATPDGVGITSKVDWTKNVQMTIINAKGKIDYEGTMQMKGRGNTTWSYPKKPYALKLDSKSKILGMKKHKRWCLLANWMDRTLMRNAVSYEIARHTTGLEWTPSGEYTELVLNGKHLGNYWLCEQIKVDENRVNITELDADATEGSAIEGGYIFELDTYYDETYKFKTAAINDASGNVLKKELPWQFKDPDEVNDAQFNYVKSYVTAMEDALYDEDKFAAREFVNYMDLNSFVDWWFVHELAQNGEPGHPKSSYMNKDVGGKMKAGPVWDFDWGTYRPRTSYAYTIATAIYYKKLFMDAGFKALVKERWNAQKTEFEKIPDYIDKTTASIKTSEAINAAMWPLTGRTTNGDESNTFEEAVAKMKQAYQEKLEWLDAKIQSY